MSEKWTTNAVKFTPCRHFVMNFDNSAKRCYFALILVLLWHVSATLSFQIHLSSSDPGGHTVINASKPGHDWRYSIDQKHQVLPFASISSILGIVSLRKTIDCQTLTINPVHFKVISTKVSLQPTSKTAHNSSVIPYFIFIQGPGCVLPKVWLRRRLKGRNADHLIKLHLPGSCVSTNQTIMSLYDYIPFQFQSCYIRATPLSPKVLVDPLTLNFSFIGDTCISNEIREKIEVAFLCANSHSQFVPYVIVLRPYRNEISHTLSHSIHQRVRRQASNTGPHFEKIEYRENIKEEQEAGLLVKTITATDPDDGDAGVLTYSMEANDDLRSQNMFAIDSSTGSVRTTVKLDREVMPKHSFTVTATDNAVPESERRSATTYLIITVDDVNDHEPSFSQSSSRIDVLENLDDESEVFVADAIDSDAGDNAVIRYSIINPGPPNDAFIIDPQTGSISTRHSLDREKESSYKLIIQATDQGDLNERKTSTFTLFLNVADENDNSPKFLEDSYIIQLKENHPVSRSKEILNITATDADEGVNAEVSYRLSTDTDTFEIDEFSGKLFLVKSLNYEDTKEYQLRVWAEDQGVIRQRSLTSIVVWVIDVNDNEPRFIESSYRRNVDEDIAVGTSFLQVQAEDYDSGRNSLLTYSIIDSSSTLPFSIDSQTGWIKTNRNLDREVTESFSFVVKAEDGGESPLSATASVEVTVKDINDNAPKFEHRMYNATISEEAGKGDQVISLVALDLDEGDNARMVYTIDGGNDRNMFVIRMSQGQGIISVNEKLDAREQSKYVLTVKATDIDGQSDSVLVNIDVTDTNRYPPEFQRKDQFSFDVSEDVNVGTSVFEVLAVDRDRGENSRITYALIPSSVFSIDPISGVIKTRQSLDSDSTPVYILRVTATDNGRPALQDEAELVVTVTDVNDNKPEFKEHRYEGSVSEDSRTGVKIVQVSATDKDKGVNAQVRYTFKEGADGNGAFSIDTQGWVKLAKVVDREVKSFYDLIAVAMDSDPISPQSSSVVVHIDIKDVNDNSPIFDSNVFTVLIEENSPIGSTVAKITADDPDEGANALVEYTLASGKDSDLFQLSGLRGEPAIITNLVKLDYETRNEYELTLQAASDTRISKARVVIKVEDVNDNIPILEDFSIIYNNFGGTFPSGPIGKIPAYDPDVSDSDKLEYKILQGNNAELLHLNESSGEVTLDPRLNSDVPRSGTFQISVSDGVTEVKATCWLWVRLVTMDMLHNAVNIRLDKMTQLAFLSPLLKFFEDALATILGTDKSNIFIINIEDDVDVSAQILNVSVSVRKGSVIVQGQTTDVFYSPEYIREVIYLHRIMLANLSTLQVLPFDDNLCLREPCTNYEACRSIVYKGVARPFLSSRTVLFRPVHPTQIFECVCPHGFAGMNQSKMCDTEIDLCYSFPCQNNGLCLRHESGYSCQCPQGFSGASCELNMTASYDSLSCPTGQCHGPSHCVPQPGKGFACEGCPDSYYHDEQCRVKTKSFQRGSYLTFPSIKARNRFTIEMRFATQEKNGLLLYNGRFNGEHDFVALEVVGGQVRFSFCLGSNVTNVVSTNVQGGFNTGQWTTLRLEYVSRVATLTVGEDCDTEIAIKYADKLGSYACAVRVTQELDEFCDNPMNNCNRLLDLTGPLQLGGLPLQHSSPQLSYTDFTGCMSDILIDHQLLDLGSSIADHLTTDGCPSKEVLCEATTCKLGGTCSEGWNTFLCDCPERTGGKDCSQSIEVSRQLQGNGYLSFSQPSQPVISKSWYNGISFRTRSPTGVLMQILLTSREVTIQMRNGYVQYSYDNSQFVFDSVRVDDGQWHSLVFRWFDQGEVSMFLDYGQYTKTFNMSSSAIGKTIEMVYVGASRDGNQPMAHFFTGCVKDIQVGNIPQSFLREPSETNVAEGCVGEPVCQEGMCGAGRCVDEWNSYQCECPPGTIGPECQDVCTNFNPCQNWAECQQPGPGEDAYTCECGVRQSGQYCENQAPLSCPTGWWGKPVCGPCQCDTQKGFEETCNKDNGTCSCKALHYLPVGGDTCFPCDCYKFGSQDITCDPCTGQCKCHEGVVGRRCDQCDSIFASVGKTKKTLENGEEEEVVTCIVLYNYCPRNHALAVWWEQIAFGLEAVQDCPVGATGNARRECTERNSWLEPDLFGCTSNSFLTLDSQLVDFESGVISPYIADYTMGLLKNISYTTTPIYGGDILMVYRYAKVTLDYEMEQPGLGMISQQYRDFVQKLLVVLSNVTDEAYSHYWQRVNELTGGGTLLLNLFEKFVSKLVTLLPETQSATFEAVSDDMVLGVDWLTLNNISMVTIPKYDNNVKKGSVDKEVSISFPSSLFTFSANDPNSALDVEPAKVYVGYVVYRDFGKHMSMNVDSSIQRTSQPLAVNSPIFSIVLSENGKVKTGSTSSPVSLRFRLLLPNNRTNLQCVRWVPSSSNEKSGTWTASDCRIVDTSCQVSVDSENCEEYYVTCHCSHLSTYAVIVDVGEGSAPVVNMEVLTYILTTLSLLLLLLSFFILITFKRLQCNWNSIRINIIFTIFIIELAYVIGINNTTPELFCRLIAICLHYFYMACFAWVFVEILHMYRMLTEKQTINYGAMKFYYLLGYVIPGIVVSLAVGLYTDAYGNFSFCWLSTSEAFIWSFAGPMALVAVLNVITFVFAAKASCAEKIPVSDVGIVRMGLLSAMLLLFLLSTQWILGLLSVNFAILALHYLHALFLFLEGLFVFLVYIVFSKKVRWCAKRFYYRLQGKKVEFDQNLSGARNSVQSRSALAYRHDSSTEGGLRINNVGISTTSTTSRSSKSSKGDKYLQSTSSSVSAVPGVTNIPYGFESPFKEATKEEPGKGMRKDGHDSDSDSDVSIDRNSLELASSHSSDEDDDFDVGPQWESQLPKSKAVELAIEQLEKMKKDKERERLGNIDDDIHADSPAGDESPSGRIPDPPPVLGPNPPDVTLSTLHNRPVPPPLRTDSLPYPPSQSLGLTSNTVQVLTHNGSISSDSESSETTV